MKQLKVISSLIIIVAMLMAAVPAQAAEQIFCPEGTVRVAKYEWNSELGYVFASGLDVITFSADSNADGGTWYSEIYIFAVSIIDGMTQGGEEKVVTTYTYSFPGALTGTFSTQDFEDPYKGRDISHIDFCTTTTAVSLNTFSAKAARGSVTVNWSTATELDNAGFNVYRSTSIDGVQTRLNNKMLAAKGSMVSGAGYSFADASGYGNFYYWLEDVSLSGETTLHGPVLAVVTPSFRSPLYRPAIPGR